jgi:hypothetical protein
MLMPVTANQLRALRIVQRANARSRLPSTADLRRDRVHPRTLQSLRERGWIELHLPAVGTDGYRVTTPGDAALRAAARRDLRTRIRRAAERAAASR